MEDRMLKSREAARMIGISPRTLAKWRQRGVGPQCVRLGYNLVVYRLSDIDTWTRTRARHMPKATADDTLDFEPTCPIALLGRQLDVMDEYALILRCRANIEHIDLGEQPVTGILRDIKPNKENQ